MQIGSGQCDANRRSIQTFAKSIPKWTVLQGLRQFEWQKSTFTRIRDSIGHQITIVYKSREFNIIIGRISILNFHNNFADRFEQSLYGTGIGRNQTFPNILPECAVAGG